MELNGGSGGWNFGICRVPTNTKHENWVEPEFVQQNNFWVLEVRSGLFEVGSSGIYVAIYTTLLHKKYLF